MTRAQPAWRSAAAHTGVAFLAMGGWAAFANRNHPMPAPLYAGLLQGAISATITYGLKRVVEAVSARTRGFAAILWPTLAAWAVSMAILMTLHSLAGTPELATTVALPNMVATVYAALYARAIRRRA